MQALRSWLARKLKPVMRAGENCSVLVPNDLLVMHEPDLKQAIQRLCIQARHDPAVARQVTGGRIEFPNLILITNSARYRYCSGLNSMPPEQPT